MLEALPAAEPDTVMAVMARFRDDPRPHKVDLGVGVYKDADGNTPVFRAVRAAEARIAGAEVSKVYTGFTGDPAVTERVAEALLGPERLDRVAGCQSTGGTGALYVLGRLAAEARPGLRCWLPTPTWINHASLLGGAGLAMTPYPWLDAAGRELDFEAVAEALEKVPAGDLVILHACCHNPSGADPSPAQWARLADIAARRGWVPFFDVAYPGLADGWEEDLAGLRLMVDATEEALIGASGSKSFGLYRDRAGVALVVNRDAGTRAAATASLALANRNTISFPPWRPGEIMRVILEDEALRADWQDELAEMRARLAAARRALAQARAARPGGEGWTIVADQKGMFSLLGLSDAQVARLRDEHAVFALGPGRINVAGMPLDQADRIADALLSVV
ncbi:MAG: aromatic amino acid transaminase [Pseudomonadota bacterium]